MNLISKGTIGSFLLIGLAASPVAEARSVLPHNINDPPQKILKERKQQVLRRLQTLKREGARFNQDCRSVKKGSAKDHDCRSRLQKLQQKQRSLTASLKRVDVKIEKANKLSIKIVRLKNRLRNHEQVIRNMGFQTTAGQFDDWAKRSEKWRSTYTSAAINTSIGIIISATENSIHLKKLKGLDKKTLNKQITVLKKALKKAKIKAPQVIKNFRKFVDASRADEKKVMLKKFLRSLGTTLGILVRDKYSSQKTSSGQENVWRAVASTLSIFVDNPEHRRVLGWVGYADFALTTVMAGYTIATVDSGVKKLTQATEAQLKALEKVSKMIQADMKAYKKTRKQLYTLP